MSEFRVDKITNRTGDTGPQICGVSTFSGTSGMAMPSGPTEYRGGRGRGVFGPGTMAPANVNTLNYITISTTGNAADFGDLSYGSAYRGGFASPTRGVWVNGQNNQTTDYVTISSKGGGSDFGEITSENMGGATFSNEITGFRAGGSDGGVFSSEIIGVIIAQTGSFYDFGDLINAVTYQNGASSPTRGLSFGGATPATPTAINLIEYITIATRGNAQDFGNLSEARKYVDTACNSTRALAAGGSKSPGASNVIDYVTIATEGNATDFGDLIAVTETSKSGVVSSATRGVFGTSNPARNDDIEYVTISTTGDSIDFGDLTENIMYPGGCSDSHGGLG